MTKTLNQLTEITALADDDLLLARDVSAVEDFKITLANLREATGVNQRTIYVGSVADLRASSGLYGEIRLQGYYGPESMGGGDLYVDDSDATTADNASTVFVAADGKRVKRVENGIITPEQCGALGDGTTIDTAALERFLEFFGTRTLFGRSSGVYVTDSTLNISNVSGGYFDALGAVIKSDGSMGETEATLVFTNVTDSKINNLVSDGNQAARTTSTSYINSASPYLIRNNCKTLVFNGCTAVNGVSFGYRLDVTSLSSDPQSDAPTDIQINNCFAYDNGQSGVVSLAHNNLSINNLHGTGNGTRFTDQEWVLHIERGGIMICSGTNVSGIYGDFGIYATNGIRDLIVNGYQFDAEASPREDLLHIVLSGGKSRRVIFSNGILRNGGIKYGADSSVDRRSHIKFTDTEIWDSPGYGIIETTETKNTNVSNVDIIRPAEGGILLNGSTREYKIDNVHIRDPGYGAEASLHYAITTGAQFGVISNITLSRVDVDNTNCATFDFRDTDLTLDQVKVIGAWEEGAGLIINGSNVWAGDTPTWRVSADSTLPKIGRVTGMKEWDKKQLFLISTNGRSPSRLTNWHSHVSSSTAVYSFPSATPLNIGVTITLHGGNSGGQSNFKVNDGADDFVDMSGTAIPALFPAINEFAVIVSNGANWVIQAKNF